MALSGTYPFMPLNINLLHEEQLLLQQRKRDPLKLGMLAICGVALLFVAYYGYRILGSNEILHDLRDRQHKWATQEPRAKAAAAQEEVLSAKLGQGKAVSQRIEGRFYWAPVLSLLVETVTPNVQILSFQGSSDTASSAADRVTITVEGIAADAEPRAAAEQFRQNLADRLGKLCKGATASFKSLDETKAAVTLAGRQVPAARFSIEVDLTRPDAAGAAPGGALFVPKAP